MSRIKEFILHTFSDEFYQNIAKLFSASTIARVFPFLFAFGLARIYLPEHFGDFVLFLTIGSILSIISTGRYENAVIIADTDENANKIMAFGIKLSFLTNLIFLGIGLILIFIPSIKIHPFFIVLVPVYSFFFSWIQFLRSKLTRDKNFKLMAYLEIAKALFIGLGQFAFFFIPSYGLYIGASLGAVGTVLIIIPFAHFVDTTQILKSRIFNNKLAHRFANFPKYMMPGELLNFVSSQLPILMFKPMFGGIDMGLYSFSHRYIGIPVQLLGKSISDVFIQKASSIKTNKNILTQLTLGLYKRQLLIGILPFSVLGLWGAEIFGFFFGQNYYESGILAQYISPWLFAVMLGSPLSSLLIVFEKQKFSMLLNVFFILMRTAAILIGYFLFQTIFTTVLLYSMVGFSFFMFITWYSLNLAGVKFKEWIGFTIKLLLIIEIPLFIIKFVLC